jgi:hypothetical protein
MHSLAHSHWRRDAERLENSIRTAFLTAGSLLITILTILILFFGVFVVRTK